MIPMNLKNSPDLDRLLRFLDWKYNGSEAPDDGDLESIGQVVMEAVISESNCRIGGVLAEFSVDHLGRRELPDTLKREFCCGVVGGEGDLLSLNATFTWCPDGNGGPRREIRDITIYAGTSFKELWAVWKSWTSAGECIMLDLAEYMAEKKRKEAEKAEKAEKEDQA